MPSTTYAAQVGWYHFPARLSSSAISGITKCPLRSQLVGSRLTASSAIELLDLPPDTVLVTRDIVERAKPDPHLFLAAASLLEVDPRHCFVVGDSVWDLLAAQRASSLGVGLLSGGYGRAELQAAGAYRVYADPEDMLDHLEEVGVRPAT